MERICIENILQDSRVAIYGAGESGKKIKMILEYLRPDITTLFFIDSFKSFTFESLQCFKLSEAISKFNEIDLILIASAFYMDISNVLDILGVQNYYVIDRCYYRLNFTRLEDLKTMGKQFEQCRNRSLISRMSDPDSYIRSIENDLNDLKSMQDVGFWPLSVMIQISKNVTYDVFFVGMKDGKKTLDLWSSIYLKK